MKVVLREDVEKLGLRGEVVDVARGYARNFLLPRRLAEPATPSRVAELEKVNARRALSEAQSFDQAQEIAQRLGQAEIRFDVKAGETGVLFGSVTQTNLADAIWEKLKVRVDRRKIELAEPLKRIGRYQVPIELFTDVTVETRVLVVPEGGELPPEEELAGDGGAEAAEAAAAEAAAGGGRGRARGRSAPPPRRPRIEEQLGAGTGRDAAGIRRGVAPKPTKCRNNPEPRHPRQPTPRSHKSRPDFPQALSRAVDRFTKNPLTARNSTVSRVRLAGDDVRQAGENRPNVRSLALQSAHFSPRASVRSRGCPPVAIVGSSHH